MSATTAPGEEFTALWQAGFHNLDAKAIQAKCVDAFPLSATRPAAMNAFLTVLGRLTAIGLNADIWLDGSFVTEKINPSDIDFILVVDAMAYDGGTTDQRHAIDALIDGADWLPAVCDTNVAFVDSPENSNSADVLAYWQRRFGYSVGSQAPKGIVVAQVGTGRAAK